MYSSSYRFGVVVMTEELLELEEPHWFKKIKKLMKEPEEKESSL